MIFKPIWIRKKLIRNENIKKIRNEIKKNGLHSVCEEAACPNLMECFSRNSATFMILGKICTRNCPFCNVQKGRPKKPDLNEPKKLADTIYKMRLKYVVLTSVNRDDLRDGGADHFVRCIGAIRKKNIDIKIEILVPDFRRCLNKALKMIHTNPPDVFNHNIENVPRLYGKVRPGADYESSLRLLKFFKERNPKIYTKSGLMVGLGEKESEIFQVIEDLHSVGVNILTIGQYLQPSPSHLPVHRYVSPKEFKRMERFALETGFNFVFCGPFVRSSYYAESQIIQIKK